MASKTLNTRIVLRNDTAQNWLTANPVLLKGEAGYETDTNKLKFGDGTTNYNDLPYFGGTAVAVYETEINAGTEHIEAITGVVDGAPLHAGDIAIVKELIAGDKRQYTAYVYDGAKWTAMDGNYSAENVYLKDDITLAGNYTQVGNLTKSASGTATFSVAGKSIAEALMEIFSKRLQPTATQPSCGITLTGAGAKEVGTLFTPSYTTSFNPGSYTYGPATGVTASTYSVSDGSTTLTTATGSFAQLTVSDSTNYKLTLSVTHTEGVVANDNLGSASDPEVKIAAGSKSATSSAVTGYRNMFFGTMTTKPVDITSADIRALTTKQAKGNVTDKSIAIPTGALRVVFAVPGDKQITSIKDVNGLNAQILSSFTTKTVSVEGANGFTAIEYTVYYMDYASANDTANSYLVTVANA